MGPLALSPQLKIGKFSPILFHHISFSAVPTPCVGYNQTRNKFIGY